MLYDLNIPWSPSTPTDQLIQTLSFAASLGYDTVALNHVLELPLAAHPKSPFPKLASDDSTTARKLPNILHRATVPLVDASSSNFRLPALAAVYDLVAVRPLSEWAFQHACLSLDVPLISLDLTTHFPYHFRPRPCMAAVSRGVRFEISYAQLLNADARGRANFIANLSALVRVTRGRGFVLSSAASDALFMRAPADAVNLMSVWGLASEKGLEGFRSLPRSLVVNEGIKRSGFRGVVDIVQVASAPDAAATKPVQDDGSSTATTKPNNGQKRKSGAEQGAPQTLSKRQAKKMRLAERQQQSTASLPPDKNKTPS
ncbi:hypothetical protein CDD81_4496 [Ophiocordyceps australis]|uniref:RNase P subunit p30 n=1 Tax=Ophiocordyceps australis TaxID=1399860 RepID=A0A2C5YJL1_9HYPO|nr:hypothetical protein CDD81_4496 [Ophiocordyceps australis]